MVIARTKYCRILFGIIIFFLVFDGVRSNILFNEFFSPLKELVIVLLFIEVIHKQKQNIKLTKILGVPMKFFFIYHCIVSFISLIFSELHLIPNAILTFYKFSLIFFLSISFYFYEKITYQPIEKLYKLIISFTIIYSILNIISVFIPLPIWKDNNMWFGRFSIGYPTADTITLCFSLILLLYNKLQITKKRRILYISLITFNIIMQVTGTALLLLPSIICIYIAIILKEKFLKSIITIFACIILLAFIIPLIGSKFESTLGTQYENAKIVFKAKMQNFIEGEETNNLDSKSARINQYKNAQRFIKNSIFHNIMGAGITHFTMDANKLSKGHEFFHIENMFYVIRICYGIIGFILYIIFFLNIFLKIIKNKTSSKEKAFLLSALAIILVPNLSLVALYLIQIYGVMAFIIAYIAKNQIITIPPTTNKIEV